MKKLLLVALLPLASGALVALLGGASTGRASAPAAAPATASDHLLEGVIDFHCHSGPDVIGRSMTDFDVVRQAKAAGMRAVVLKNHYTMTADRAQLAMQEIGGIQVYGGITLNLSVGGLNPEAVRKMVQMDGQRGRIVWLPTYDGEAQVKQSGENRPFVAVVKDGQVVPALKDVLDLVAQHHLILETGHSAAAESLVILEAAKKLGISKMVVTHALSVPGGATDGQLQRMAELGAIVEFTWLAQLPAAQAASAPAATARAGTPARVTVAEYARVIRLIGAEHAMISSDMGQVQNPSHVQAMHAFMLALKGQGVSDAQIDLVARKNPAALLGLEP